MRRWVDLEGTGNLGGRGAPGQGSRAVLSADTSADAAVGLHFSCPHIRWSLAFEYCLYFLFVYCQRSDLMVQGYKMLLDGCRRRVRFKVVAI